MIIRIAGVLGTLVCFGLLLPESPLGRTASWYTLFPVGVKYALFHSLTMHERFAEHGMVYMI